MLKSYEYKLQVSLNGANWSTIYVGHTELREEHALEKIFIENYSFAEAHEWLLHNWHSHLDAEYTFFKKRPKIKIQYGYDTIETYRSFKTLSMRAIYEERILTMRDLQFENA